MRVCFFVGGEGRGGEREREGRQGEGILCGVWKGVFTFTLFCWRLRGDEDGLFWDGGGGLGREEDGL